MFRACSCFVVFFVGELRSDTTSGREPPRRSGTQLPSYPGRGRDFAMCGGGTGSMRAVSRELLNLTGVLGMQHKKPPDTAAFRNQIYTDLVRFFLRSY